MTDTHHPLDPFGEVQAALERLNADPTEDRLTAAVKLLTGFTDEQLADLGGFAGFDHTTGPQLCASTIEREAIGRVFNFAAVLRAADALPPDEAEYFERPWKWQPEYAAWAAAGAPEPPDLIAEAAQSAPASLGWTRFLKSLAAL